MHGNKIMKNLHKASVVVSVPFMFKEDGLRLEQVQKDLNGRENCDKRKLEESSLLISL